MDQSILKSQVTTVLFAERFRKTTVHLTSFAFRRWFWRCVLMSRSQRGNGAQDNGETSWGERVSKKCGSQRRYLENDTKIHKEQTTKYLWCVLCRSFELSTAGFPAFCKSREPLFGCACSDWRCWVKDWRFGPWSGTHCFSWLHADSYDVVWACIFFSFWPVHHKPPFQREGKTKNKNSQNSINILAILVRICSQNKPMQTCPHTQVSGWYPSCLCDTYLRLLASVYLSSSERSQKLTLLNHDAHVCLMWFLFPG